MIIHQVEQKSQEWLDLREGKVTGSTLSKILSPRKDVRERAFYGLLAARLKIEDGIEETDMERGNRLEDEAREEYEEESGNKVEKIGFTTRDDNQYMGESPDGLIKVDGKYRGALEIKCLGCENHIKAKVEGKIPEDYEAQVLQKFIINDDLEWLDFVLYDPRITIFPYLKFRVTREEIKDKVEEARVKEEEFLKQVEEKLAELLPF